MSSLREALDDYLRLRRQLGFEMPQDGRLLEGFVEFLERAGAERITTELALNWARMPVHAHPHYWRPRLSVVRGFARHLATIDPASEVPSKDLLAIHSFYRYAALEHPEHAHTIARVMASPPNGMNATPSATSTATRSRRSSPRPTTAPGSAVATTHSSRS